MFNRGDIHSPEYARLCRLFSFHAIKDVMPGKISPTDVDNVKFCERNKHFLWFEFKTHGNQMPKGQRIAFDSLLYRGRPYDALFVCQHERLDDVVIPASLTTFHVEKHDEPVAGQTELRVTPEIDAAELRYWVGDWFLHAANRPNSFITNFRRFRGDYPGPLVAWATP